MLQRLSVKNYVLIDELEIDLSTGLNIITGETGAGKSILLGALGLILGERADKSVLLDHQKKTVIEGVFKSSTKSLKVFFKNNDLDFENEIILRREISPESSGSKTRCFINDTPVPLNLLKELGELLVDIHSQHETLFLRQSKFQLSVLDAFAKTESDLEQYQQQFAEYHSLKNQLATLEEDEKKSKADKDYYQFLFNELDLLKLDSTEQQRLEEELNAMTHSEEIKTNLSAVSTELYGAEDNVISRITRLQSLLQSAAKHFPHLEELHNRLRSVAIEMKDIHAEVERLEEQILFNPSKIEAAQNRLNEIYKLEQKHRVKTTAELIELKNQFEEKLQNIDSLEGQIESLRRKVTEIKDALIASAKKISAKRVKAIPTAEKEINVLLTGVNLPNAVFKITDNIQEENNFTVNGLDEISFMFSANKGVTPREIGKVASGGELSRLMLCIKAAVAKLIALPTIIFDEIDTGISGETAVNVANVLKQLSSQHQLIAITHLPQIAGRADAHYYVYKEVTKKSTSAKVKLLSNEERTVEIAKMLSGEKPTAVALENTRELIKS